MPASTADIVNYEDDDVPGAEVLSQRTWQAMHIVEPKAAWASTFVMIAQQLRGALDGKALAIEHVGSTSVPGLAAKDVLDLDLVVPDPADEASYVSLIEAAGFRFLLREPRWFDHRLFIREPPEQAVNLHVFGPDCPELVRHRLFRNHLRMHDEDRALYEEVKRDAMRATCEEGGAMLAYRKRKQAVIREILDRAFKENGLVVP